ncbi:MAG: hypothetical protein LBD01_04590 [Puniceicoccales bacterium]|nr:hypothetical protein [Puniceicoccales bacterium]
MSNYHYLNESGKTVGPVSIEEIEKLAEAFRQNGRELLVARPGDSRWLPYTVGGAAPTAAPVAAPVRPAVVAPQAPVRPAQAQQPQAPVRPQNVYQAQPQPMAPMGAPRGMMPTPAGFPPSGFSGFSMRSTWLSTTIRVTSYVLAVLFALAALVFFVLLIVGLASGNAAAATSGVVGLPLALSFLAAALSLTWMGKVVSLLEEIASAPKG